MALKLYLIISLHGKKSINLKGKTLEIEQILDHCKHLQWSNSYTEKNSTFYGFSFIMEYF